MRHLDAVKAVARTLIVAVLIATIGVAAAGCGQRGPLYMPSKDDPEKRR